MATVESFSRWRLKREPFVRAKEVLMENCQRN